MPRKQIIKFILATGIFYACLAFNVFHIGEKIVPTSTDYVDTDISQTDQDIEDIYLQEDTPIQEQIGHSAASYTNNLDSLCETTLLCDKINYNGIFSNTEKYSYTKVIDKIVQFIDKNSKIKKQIQDTIKTITINKENGNRRGYATRDSIIFNISSVQSNKEFINLSVHELGHITDLGYIQGSSSQKDQKYTEFKRAVFSTDDLSLLFYRLSRISESIRKAEAKTKDFCSGYGMSDPFEDFAECFNLYINHNSFFKQVGKSNSVLKKKYNFIASIFSGQYISANSQDLTLIKTNINRRPRDSTRITNN